MLCDGRFVERERECCVRYVESVVIGGVWRERYVECV